MMDSSQSPMDTLRELALKALDQATRQLGQIRQSHQNAQQQLNMLLNYHDEYRQKLNTTLFGGIEAARWQNYQQFIATLEKAIEQHRGQLQQWNQKLDRATQHWQEKQQRLNAYQTLYDRAACQRLLHENRLDQKRMDEFAQRSALRNQDL